MRITRTTARAIFGAALLIIAWVGFSLAQSEQSPYLWAHTFVKNVDANSKKITGLAAPTAGGDAVTKTYADALVNDQDVKASVRVATTATITLAGGAPTTSDGVTLVAGDRILVWQQTTGSQNGLYTVTTLGTGVNGTWTRATDADVSSEMTTGTLVCVSEGDTYADGCFILTTNDAITLGTTALSFSGYTPLPAAGLADNALLAAGECVYSKIAGGILCEGDTVDGFEIASKPPDPGADAANIWAYIDRVQTFTVGQTFNGQVDIGDNGDTVAINSSDWDITATGVMTGIGAITADGLITGSAGLTITGAAVSLNASSNFAVNIGTGTTNAAVSIGGNSNTVAIDAAGWDVSTTGAVSGVDSLTSDDNQVGLVVNIPATGADAAAHTLSLQIDGQTGISLAATGNGAGGVGAGTILIGGSAAADIVTIGDANADVSITDAQWSVSAAGAPNFTDSSLPLADLVNGAASNIMVAGGTGVWTAVAMSGDCTIVGSGAIECTQADALEANGGNCAAGNAPLGVDTLGAAEGCFDVEEEGNVATTVIGDNALAAGEVLVATAAAAASWAVISGDGTMGGTGVLEVTQADALETDPTDCGANTFATAIAATGNLTCATPTLATDTNGNFLASCANGTGISGCVAAAEAAAPTLSVDQGFAPTWTATHTYQAATPILIQTATATDDRISFAIAVGGAARFNGTFTNADLTANRSYTTPDRSGTLSLSGDTFTGDVTGTLSATGATALTVAADSVALATDTTGNFMAGCTNGTGVTGCSSSENNTPTLAVSFVSGSFTGTASTTDATVTNCGTVALASGSAAVIQARIAARRTDFAGETAGYIRAASVENIAGASALIGAVTVVHTGEDTAAWEATIDVDDASDTARIRVTGEAAKSISWTCQAIVTTQ